MMDKALLESAARVAGIPGEYHEEWDAIVRSDECDQYNRGVLWRPHVDDAATFRLAVTLRIELGRAVAEQCHHPDVHELWQKDEIAATRRAVLRSAAGMDRQAGK
jgi:hypothetical protein